MNFSAYSAGAYGFSPPRLSDQISAKSASSEKEIPEMGYLPPQISLLYFPIIINGSLL
jgi:hypothetical protein